METLKLGDMSVDVTHKKIKNVHLSVYPPNGKVKVSAPLSMELETIRMYVITKLSWIRKQQNRLAVQEREAPRDYIERESHYYNGKRYLLRIVGTPGTARVELGHKYIDLFIRPSLGVDQRQLVLNEWYRKQLKQEVPSLIKQYEKIMNVEVSEFGVKQMKTKWGTCNPTAKRIWVNLELAKKPSECLEYIVVHEMVHLLEPTHNNRFVALMDEYLPKWRLYKDELNKLPVRHEMWEY